MTFLLAGIGVVSMPAVIVEPVIALSIVEAAAATLSRRELPDRVRMPVVFAFGLLHGLGFASALGIDEPWSWELLHSLLAFNLGIEACSSGSSRSHSRSSCCCDAPRSRIRRRVWRACWSAWSGSSGSSCASSPRSWVEERPD
ncbi:HupE/UreJ family protein [Agromyces sp. Soil535]|uniref:HupE/UreJ family protein n=1 Tax=Agromyces sp. Soil535 TaxID=1736390 RepID=UPI000AA9E2BF|nr:HupE/UreJ family protein [Agromyces sp. Soil535]